jgi:hypothetical protein
MQQLALMAWWAVEEAKTDRTYIVIWSLDKIKGGERCLGARRFSKGGPLSLSQRAHGGDWSKNMHAWSARPWLLPMRARCHVWAVQGIETASLLSSVYSSLIDETCMYVYIAAGGTRRSAEKLNFDDGCAEKCSYVWPFSQGELDFTVQSWARMQEEICNQKEQRNKLFLRSVVHDLDIWNQN